MPELLKFDLKTIRSAIHYKVDEYSIIKGRIIQHGFNQTRVGIAWKQFITENINLTITSDLEVLSDDIDNTLPGNQFSIKLETNF